MAAGSRDARPREAQELQDPRQAGDDAEVQSADRVGEAQAVHRQDVPACRGPRGDPLHARRERRRQDHRDTHALSMDLLGILSHVALGAVAGLLVGCVGIGGVIVVPALVYLAGYSLPTAIAAAMCAFIVSGLVGTYAYAKAGSIRWRTTWPL